MTPPSLPPISAAAATEMPDDIEKGLLKVCALVAHRALTNSPPETEKPLEDASYELGSAIARALIDAIEAERARCYRIAKTYDAMPQEQLERESSESRTFCIMREIQTPSHTEHIEQTRQHEEDDKWMT